MPGAASRKRATSSGLKDNRNLARLMHGRQVPAEVGTIKRHIEKQPQCRDCGVDLWNASAARRQMQLKAAHVFRVSCVGRAVEVTCEVLDPLHIVMLGLLRELADRHVFDHAPTQRADSLLGHGGAPVLSEGREPLISRQDAPPRYPFAPPQPQAPYRASGLVHWPDPESPTDGPAGPIAEVNPPCRPREPRVSF